MTPPALQAFFLGTLRGRLILGVAAVHAVLMTLFVADLTVRQRQLLLDRQEEGAVALSRSLAVSAAAWLAAGDVSGLQELVEAQRGYPELSFALLADEHGRVLAHTEAARRGQFLLDLPGERREAVLGRAPELVDAAAPAAVAGRHVGWARVGVGRRQASRELAALTRNGLLYALAAILVGSAIAWQMGRRITARLYAVQGAINRVRTGDRSARCRIAGRDEAATIAHEFDVMLDALADREAAVAGSEARYRLLLRNVQAAVVVHGPDTRIRIANPMAQELLGLSEEQLLGRAAIDPAWHFLLEDGSVTPLDEFPVNRVLQSGQPVRDLVMGVHRPDRAAATWVLVNALPVRDPSGAIEEVIVTFIDITKHKRAQEALRRVNRELLAIRSCNAVLVRAEEEQALLRDVCQIVCDEAGYRMTWVGYAEADAARTVRPVAWAGVEDGYLRAAAIGWGEGERGAGPTGIAIRTGRPAVFQDFQLEAAAVPWRELAAARGYRSSIALPLQDRNGTTFGAFAIYSTEPAAFTEDEVRLLEALAADLAFGISVLRVRGARQRAEEELRTLARELEQRVADRTAQLEAANQELEAFAYSVSHDLRAPLRHVDSYLDLLAKRAGGALDGQARHYMEEATAAARRMEALIDDLLSFSRMGRAEMAKERVDMGALVREVAREAEAESAGRAVEWRIAALPEVAGDRTMLRVVLQNLVANAVKFTRPRERAVIEIGALPREGAEQVFFVRDNGVGFDPSYGHRLFGVFQRLHRTEEFEGTGIGLANVRRVVARHGGRAWAEGAVGAGATFYFSLPA